MKRISHGMGAFSLVEVTMALGIAAFCLLAIFGLLPVGMKSHQNAIEQTAVAGIATGIMADLRTTPATNSTSPNYNIAIPTNTKLYLREDGSATSASGTDSKYLAWVSFSVPPQPRAATMVHLLITWPAAADLNNNPPVNYSGSFEAVSALDRN